MVPDKIIQERVEAASTQLQEVFSDFMIVGLPIDKKLEPIVCTNGDEEVVMDLITIITGRNTK